MHLTLRVSEKVRFRAFKKAFAHSDHVATFEPIGCITRLHTDAELLTPGFAEALGLSPSLQPLKVLITESPLAANWLSAPLVIVGILLDHNYEKRDEMIILISEVRKEVGRYNHKAIKQIHSIGVHEEIINSSDMPVLDLVDAIFRAFDPVVK